MGLVTIDVRRCPLVVWLLAGVCLVGGVARPAAAAPKNVLILSEGPVMPRAADLRATVVAAVRLDPAEPLNVYEELIDSTRFESDDYRRQLLELYRVKYLAAPPDVVIALTEPALDFALRYRNNLFPRAALVFGAVDQRAIRTRTLGPSVTGVFLHIDARLTVEAALTLHPGVRNIIVVAGASRFERGIVEVVQEDLRGFASRAAITYITGRPLNEVLAAVASLDESGLVLFLSLNADGNGVARSGPEVLAALRRVATAPIYGISDNFLGHGIVGGVLLDYRRHGMELGQRARQILAGERASDLPLIRTPNMVAFDWRELERFGVEAARLPAGATVVNRELSLWDTYKRTILAVGAVVVGQFVLIGSLLVQRRQRRRAERALRDLSGRLVSAQEEERRRIARELHDNVSQQIASLAIRIDQVAMSPYETQGTLARSMRELRQRTVEISTEIHSLSHQLHSSKLELLGLADALRGHCNELLAQGLGARFHDENVPESLPHDVSLYLFRIAQEALNNIVKHSGASEAHVTLRAKGDLLLLSVADSGRGFDEAAAAVQSGLGLASMRERLRLINGELTVSSRPGQGTTITARVPIPRGGTTTADSAPVEKLAV